jgi:SAM-dependent methyltransferase
VSVARDILQCPATGKSLREEAEGLRCDGRVYPIVGGVPVLLADELSIFSVREVADRQHVEASVSSLRRLARRMIPSRTLGLGTAQRYARFARLMRQGAGERQPRVLIIGGGRVGDDALTLMESGVEIVGTDVYLSPHVDVVCDAHNLPFRDESFDGVVLQAVLEHVLDPPRVVAEAHRVVRADGLVYAETPFLQGVHEGAFDFTRWTELGHRRLFRTFEEIDRGVVVGPATALVWAICYFARSFGRRRTTALVLEKLATIAFFWLKYFDRLLVERPGAADGASGTYFMGRKSATPIPDAEISASYRGTIARPARRVEST